MNNRHGQDFPVVHTRTEKFLMGCGAWVLAFMAVLILDYVARMGT